jgi:hypothetical protein
MFDTYRIIYIYKYTSNSNHTNRCSWRCQCLLGDSWVRHRLPTKANLVTRGIITSAAHFCVSDCGGVESVRHIFTDSGTFGSLWSLVRSVLDLVSGSTEHLRQFSAVHSFFRWSSCDVLLLTANLTFMCLSRLEQKEVSIV